MGKRYYWLKLPEDFFRQKPIKNSAELPEAIHNYLSQDVAGISENEGKNSSSME